MLGKFFKHGGAIFVIVGFPTQADFTCAQLRVL